MPRRSASIVHITSALNNCNVRFSLLTADDAAHVVKAPDEPWGPLTKARAAAAIRFDGRNSNLADAVMYAVELAKQGATGATVKVVFVLTDGFDAAPQRLRRSLAYACDENVMVVGIGIGYFTDGVFNSFPLYVVVNDPKLLPDGLRQLFAGDGKSDKPMSAEIESLRKEIRDCEGSTFDADNLWLKDMRRVYDKEIEETRKQLMYANGPLISLTSGLSIDICFVMDTTGSMGVHLQQAKEYIQALAGNVKKFTADLGKSAELKMSFVSYKFFGNYGHLENYPFTTDIEELMSKIRDIQCNGGGGKEDTFGGLNTAMGFEWNKAAAKFLVLIGDMPDHILNCSGCYYCKEERRIRSSGGILSLVREMAQKNIHLLYVRTTKETADDEKLFGTEYQKMGPSRGFCLLDITGDGAANELKSLIEKQIKKVIAIDFM